MPKSSRRKDSKGRVLKTGESERKGSYVGYQYRFTDPITRKRVTIYAKTLNELREKEKRLYDMKTHQERERKNNPYRAEYEYINYDRKRIEEEYLKTKAELERIKMCVDFYIYELSYDYEI